MQGHNIFKSLVEVYAIFYSVDKQLYNMMHIALYKKRCIVFSHEDFVLFLLNSH